MRQVRIILVVAVAAIVLLDRQANAFSGYKCTVKNSYEQERDALVPHKLSNQYRKSEFIVDRATGRMLGAVSSAGWIGRNEVLDSGSQEQSYKAIYVSPPHVHVRLLQIQEYETGQVKNFMFVDGSAVLTGTCTHLH